MSAMQVVKMCQVMWLEKAVSFMFFKESDVHIFQALFCAYETVINEAPELWTETKI